MGNLFLILTLPLKLIVRLDDESTGDIDESLGRMRGYS